MNTILNMFDDIDSVFKCQDDLVFIWFYLSARVASKREG